MTFRYEIKFPINKINDYKFFNWINNIQNIKKHHPDRVVNNCYYDTPSFKFANDNLIGITPRIKYRVRWYGDDIKANLFFELKIKKNKIGYKKILPLNIKNNNFNFNNLFALDIFKKIDKNNNFYETINEIKSQYIKPIIFVNYIRKYYIYDKNVRITFDQNIGFKEYRFFKNNFTRDSLNIIEIKFNSNISKDVINNFLKKCPFTVKRNSKYLRGLSICKMASYV